MFKLVSGLSIKLILIVAIIGYGWYMQQRLESLSTENTQLSETVDTLETQQLEFEMQVDQQRQAVTALLEAQGNIRTQAAKQKTKLRQEQEERKHAAETNPAALGNAVTNSLTNIMQQLKDTTSTNSTTRAANTP